MLERLVIVLLVIGVGFGAYALGTRWQTARIGRRGTGEPILDALRPGIPAVVYFWADNCVPCRTVQTPAIDELEAALGPDGVQIMAVNALEQPELADGWGVLSLPTTFIIDRTGQPRRVNHGVARIEQLRQQVESVSQPAEHAATG